MTTKQTIDFYFDLTSPYSYVAAEEIEDIAKAGNCEVNYLPTLLGFVFKATGNSAPMMNPAKGQYSAKDFLRTARFHNLPIEWPKQFPINATLATRAILKLKDQMPNKVGAFTLALFRAYFVQGKDITSSEGVAEVANAMGLDGADLAAANEDETYKAKSKALVEQSIKAGMFGAPYFVVGDECFWGQDRMPQLRRWVVEGPF